MGDSSADTDVTRLELFRNIFIEILFRSIYASRYEIQPIQIRQIRIINLEKSGKINDFVLLEVEYFISV